MPVIPYLKYEDVAAALDWLTNAFGFTERLRYSGDDNKVVHAEMMADDGSVIFLAGPGGGYRNPRSTGYVNVMVSVAVDDVDAQYQRALAAGATEVFSPSDTPQGMRVCKLLDPEGQEWFFSQTLSG
jgi:PhnB protein